MSRITADTSLEEIAALVSSALQESEIDAVLGGGGAEDTTYLETEWGRIRIITPTQSVMDRVAWFAHGNDAQSRAQAIMVASHQDIDWDAIYEWAYADGIDRAVVESIREQAERT